MNTVITSKEEILKAARELALEGNDAHLGIRELAGRCGVSVGAIYYYFPTKADLTVALVADVWQAIFDPALARRGEADFAAFVLLLEESLHAGLDAYPGFFARHALIVTGKSKGRSAMEHCFEDLQGALMDVLGRDGNVCPDAWTAALTPKSFCAFLVDFLRSDLMRGQNRSDFLQALLKRVLY